MVISVLRRRKAGITPEQDAARRDAAAINSKVAIKGLIDQNFAYKKAESDLAAILGSIDGPGLDFHKAMARQGYGNSVPLRPEFDSEGRETGRLMFRGDPDANRPPMYFDKSQAQVSQDNDGFTTYSINTKNLIDQLPPKPSVALPSALKQALDAGVDLRPYYGETYADAVKFKQDLGQYAGKDESMIIPANPVGYGGQFKFDPNFGSAFYRDLATQSGKALGLSDEQILQKGTEYFKDKFASGAKTAGVIGFTDFGTGLIDSLATTAGVPTERLGELKGTVLKPLYDASNQVFKGLNGAARVESQSSGFFKGIGQDIAKLGPIGTIALTAALGPAAGALAGSLGGGAALATGLAAGGASALPGLLQGDISGAIKSGLTGGALAGIGAGALKGVGSTVSDALGGGSVGNIAGGAAQGAIRGGVGSLLSGGDIGQGLLSGGLFGAGTTAGAELLGQTGSALDQSRRANQEFFGLNPNAKSPTVDFGNPQNFGPTFDLPNTIGALAGVPSIGGLFDDVEFPGVGLNPNATGLLDLGSGLGQGLTNPTSPNVPGQLGQGLTVRVPGGTLGQGGVTPTGQITLGNPNSFINGGTQGSSSGFDVSKLLKGLLGAGTAAAVGNALTRSPQQQQTQQALPVQRFSMNPQMFNYQGDPAKYGETDIGNFQFYKPNLGLLG